MKKITFLSILFWVTICFAWSPPADKLPSIQGALANPAFMAVIALKDGGEEGCTPDNSALFNGGAEDPPSGWTEVVGTDWVIANNRLEFDDGGSSGDHLILHDTTTSSASQYVKGVFDDVTCSSACGIGLAFRQQADGDGYSLVYWQGDLYFISTLAGIWEDESATTLAISEDDVIAATISGTGTSATVRVWVNPTGNCPDSSTSWGGDSTPSVTFTASGFGYTYDTETLVGVWGNAGGTGEVALDDFYSGSY